MFDNAPLKKLFRSFDNAGFEVRIVGGAVRDFLLGQEPKDIDLCTDATPEEMQDIATINGFKFLPTGLQHGTATFVVDDELFEVTTLRIDVETDGRHAKVEFTRSFEEDAARRDLTINAMSMDLNGDVYDYFGGREDLADKRVRFVGEPDDRVKEDYLRILRYFRFMARFGWNDGCMNEIKAITSQENLEGLKTISVERYWLEMQKLVKYPFADDVLDAMYFTGVLSAIGLERRRDSTFHASAVAGLSTMVTEDTVDTFLETWKLSADEQKHLRYLVKNRYVQVDWQSELTDGVPRLWLADLAGVAWRDSWMRMQILNWEIPTFPVTGQDLLDRGMKPGVELGAKLKDLRQSWKDSNFEATKDQLLTFL